MKTKELRDLSLTELKSRISDAQTSIQKLQFNRAVTGQLENPAQIRQFRREIARLKTIVNEKESA